MIVQLEQDPDTKELILPIPVDLLSQMGWSEGTDLFWIDNEDGSFTLKEKVKEDGNETSSTVRPQSTITTGTI